MVPSIMKEIRIGLKRLWCAHHAGDISGSGSSRRSSHCADPCACLGQRNSFLDKIRYSPLRHCEFFWLFNPDVREIQEETLTRAFLLILKETANYN